MGMGFPKTAEVADDSCRPTQYRGRKRSCPSTIAALNILPCRHRLSKSPISVLSTVPHLCIMGTAYDRCLGASRAVVWACSDC
jgi:hypothetical protein